MCVCALACQTETRSRAGKIHPQCKKRSRDEVPGGVSRFFSRSTQHQTLYSLSIYTCTVCDWKRKRTSFSTRERERRGQWTIYSHTSPFHKHHFYMAKHSVATCQRKTRPRGDSLCDVIFNFLQQLFIFINSVCITTLPYFRSLHIHSIKTK